MKKAMVVVLLAMAVPAFAGNLDPAAAKPWNAPWGTPATVTDLGGGKVQMSIDNGSAGIFWRLPAWPSEIVSVTGFWEGATGGAGWAEVLIFTSTEGMSDAAIGGFIDGTAGGSPQIVAKKDSWGLNPPNPWGLAPIEAAATGWGPFEIHATCAEVIIGLKVGSSGADQNLANVMFDISYVPEPATALLLGLPLMLLRRRR